MTLLRTGCSFTSARNHPRRIRCDPFHEIWISYVGTKPFRHKLFRYLLGRVIISFRLSREPFAGRTGSDMAVNHPELVHDLGIRL